MARTNYYSAGTFEKLAPQNDGSLIVEGIASAPFRDKAGEIIEASAMKEALAEWFKSGPTPLREMHGMIAAGRVLEGHVRNDGATWIRAHVVDKESCRKVKAGVLSMFSVGGRVTRRDEADATRIRGLTLSEVSLVDAGCLAQARIETVKEAAANDSRVGLGSPPQRHGTASPEPPVPIDAPAFGVPYDAEPAPAPDAPAIATAPKLSRYDGRCIGCGDALPMTCPKCATPSTTERRPPCPGHPTRSSP